MAKTKRKVQRKKNGNEVKKTENKVWLASYHSFVCVCFFMVLFFVFLVIFSVISLGNLIVFLFQTVYLSPPTLLVLRGA